MKQPIYRCGNCAEEYSDPDEYDGAADAAMPPPYEPLDGPWCERLDTDGIVPAGICPANDCGALVYQEPSQWVSAELLRRALPLLVQLGDFIGNGPINADRPDSLGTRCDLIADMRAALEE